MAPLSENDVRRLIDDVMGSSVNWPQNFKKSLPPWLEISQPAFYLNQLLGWKDHIGNNGAVSCTSPLVLTATPTLVTGMETTLYSAGTYLVTVNMVVTLTVTTANTGAIFGTSPAVSVDRGFPTWNNGLANVFADDASTAFTSGVDNECDYLRVKGFFNVPPQATVVGIAAAIDAGNGNSTGTWHSQLMKAGVLAGTEDTSVVGGTQPEAHGGATDLWGTTWTGLELNDPDFGISLFGDGASTSVNWVCDYIALTAYLENLHDVAVGYLFVDGVQQSATLSVPVGPGQTASGSGSWFVETTADDIDIEFRAEKTYDAPTPSVTTSSELIVARLS